MPALRRVESLQPGTRSQTRAARLITSIESLKINKRTGRGKSGSDRFRRNANSFDLLPKHLLHCGFDLGCGLGTHKGLEVARVHVGTKIFVEYGQLPLHVIECLSDNFLVGQSRAEEDELTKLSKPPPDS